MEGEARSGPTRSPTFVDTAKPCFPPFIRLLSWAALCKLQRGVYMYAVEQCDVVRARKRSKRDLLARD